MSPTRAEETSRKREKQRKIIDAVRKSPRTSQELQNLFNTWGITDRTFRNYLEDLTGIGVLFYDQDSKLYTWCEHKREYTKKEYDIALKHSKEII